MAPPRDSVVFEGVRIVVLCLVWYGVSAAGNVIVKELLNDFPFPLSVTLAQLFFVWILSFPLLWILKVPAPEYLNKNRGYFWKVIIPLAVGKFLAQFSSHVSLWKVPVSYTHTVKATMPLFTVILSRLILREKQSLPVYFSLLPIIIGVIIATVTEISFNMLGLISALLSTFGFSLQNIFSKKSLKDISIHHYALLSVLAKYSLLIFLPCWFFFDGRDIFYTTNYYSTAPALKITFFLVIDGFLNFLHNVVAFTMISLVSPLSYSIANSTKRIVVICISLVILRNPVTTANVIGMSLALFGVMLYNKAKYDQRRTQQKQSIIPLSRSEPHLSRLNYDHIKLNHPDADLTSRHHPTLHMGQPYFNGFIPNYASQTFKNV